jgi:cytochrome c
MKSTLAMAVLAVSATALMTQGAQAAGDPTAGEHVFRICMACHAIGPGAKNKVGPELNGIDGRHSGTAPGYSYSEANKKSGIVWNEQTFKKYIHDPRAMIPGTKMIFPGIKNAKQVDDLWAYVSQFGPDGKKK